MIESTGSLTYIVMGNDPELTLVEQGANGCRPGDKLRVEIRPELGASVRSGDRKADLIEHFRALNGFPMERGPASR